MFGVSHVLRVMHAYMQIFYTKEGLVGKKKSLEFQTPLNTDIVSSSNTGVLPGTCNNIKSFTGAYKHVKHVFRHWTTSNSAR